MLNIQEAFENADATFEVVKRPLEFIGNDGIARGGNPKFMASVRADKNIMLGVVGANWEPIQNSDLIGFAGMLREEISDIRVGKLKGSKLMHWQDAAVVYFQATLRGTEQCIVPEDQVQRTIVGYVGHDATVAFGGTFTNTRVICMNTLQTAITKGNEVEGRSFSVRHHSDAAKEIQRILAGLDLTRQHFATQCETYRHMAETPLTYDGYRDLLNRVYLKSSEIENGMTINSKPQKVKALDAAWCYGLGASIPGVRNTVWGAFNAITEVETSPISRIVKNDSGKMFGQTPSRAVVKKAEAECLALLS